MWAFDFGGDSPFSPNAFGLVGAFFFEYANNPSPLVVSSSVFFLISFTFMVGFWAPVPQQSFHDTLPKIEDSSFFTRRGNTSPEIFFCG